MLGVNIAIFQNGQILLTKREDFGVWCMPGGSVEPGESLAQAAIREVHEETGLEVELTRLVGIYSRPNWLDGHYHIAVLAASPKGGALKMQPGEVVDIRYFDLANLPEHLLIGQKQRILDAANGIGEAL